MVGVVAFVVAFVMIMIVDGDSGGNLNVRSVIAKDIFKNYTLANI